MDWPPMLIRLMPAVFEEVALGIGKIVRIGLDRPFSVRIEWQKTVRWMLRVVQGLLLREAWGFPHQ